MPQSGIKTLLALLLAWLFRGSKLAAVIGFTLHDVILPFLLVLLRLNASSANYAMRVGAVQ